MSINTYIRLYDIFYNKNLGTIIISKKILLNYLRRDFEVFEMKEFETIIRYFTRVISGQNEEGLRKYVI